MALGILGALGAGSAGADAVAWSPPVCPGGPPARVPVVATMAKTGIPDPAWYRVDARLDGDGAQVGQRVTVGGAGGANRTIDLAAESFAAGPFGGTVLTGSDDGRRSRLELLDLAAGCSRLLAVEGAVIRRATLDPTGGLVYEFRVDRRTRADLGVWRRSIDGTGPARRVLEPIEPDDRFGRTFSTELSWTAEGDRLVVQSCGAFACRTRTLDPLTGGVELVAEPDLGELIGVSGDRLIAYEACRGLPCPIVSVGIGDGDRTAISEASGLAVLVRNGSSVRVVHEDGAEGPGHLRVSDLAGIVLERVETDPGTRLMPGPARAQAGAGVPNGWLVLAPDGRPDADRGPASFLRPAGAGSAADFEEVSR